MPIFIKILIGALVVLSVIVLLLNFGVKFNAYEFGRILGSGIEPALLGLFFGFILITWLKKRKSMINDEKRGEIELG